MRVSPGQVNASRDGSCFDNTAVLTLRVNYDDLRCGEVGHAGSESENPPLNSTGFEKPSPKIAKTQKSAEMSNSEIK